ncbi:MAG: Loki-CTERM sorting domain-containing protein, partial [Promethearchaeota archaeon]
QFFGTAPNRYLVIEYYQVVDYSDELPIGDCEVILYEHGNITLQYKNLYDHIYPTIGLDHGDLTNYNYYDPDLPLTDKAINFTFNSMIECEYGLIVNENDEFMYLTKEINHAQMDYYFGTSWEVDWGLLPDMNSNEIMKINITSIVDNTTHWDIDYDIWDWIPRLSSFSSVADSTGNILIRQEPADYPDPHYLPNTFPFILPNNTGVWMVRANLDPFYEDFEYENDSNITIIEADNFLAFDEVLHWEAHYDEKGILELIDVSIINYYHMDQINRIFRMARIINVTKPSYIGVNEGDSFEYRVSYIPDNAPPSGGITLGFDRIKLFVGVIAGEDPTLNRTLIYFDYGFFIPGYNMFSMTYNSRGFLYRNTTYSKLIYSGFIFSFIVATNINWTILCEDIPGSTPLSNGFHIEMGGQSMTYTFNSNGVLNTLSYGYLGEDYLIIYLYKPSPGAGGGDDDDGGKEEEETIPGYSLFIVFGILGVATLALIKRKSKSNK